MPEAVKRWVESKDPQKCYEIHHDIIDTYKQDFNKYAKKFQIKYLELLFNQIPLQLGTKFKFSTLGDHYRKRDLSPCLDSLLTSNVVHKITHSSGQGIPIGAEVKLNKFKVVFLDIALAQALLGIDLSSWFIDPKINFVNKGSLLEAFVGQEILAYSNPHQKAYLYYWQRETRSSKAEVDYLIQQDNQVVPIEVKSNKGNTLKSLKLFLSNHKKTSYGFRFSKHNYSFHENIYSYPLYAIFKALKKDELIKKFISE